MPTYCCVPGCHNKIGSHKFPTDPVVRQKWMQVIKRDSWEPTRNSVVCRVHFRDQDFDENNRPGRRTKLKPGTVPSLFGCHNFARGVPIPMSQLRRQDKMRQIAEERANLAIRQIGNRRAARQSAKPCSDESDQPSYLACVEEVSSMPVDDLLPIHTEGSAISRKPDIKSKSVSIQYNDRVTAFTIKSLPVDTIRVKSESLEPTNDETEETAGNINFPDKWLSCELKTEIREESSSTCLPVDTVRVKSEPLEPSNDETEETVGNIRFPEEWLSCELRTEIKEESSGTCLPADTVRVKSESLEPTDDETEETVENIHFPEKWLSCELKTEIKEESCNTIHNDYLF